MKNSARTALRAIVIGLTAMSLQGCDNGIGAPVEYVPPRTTELDAVTEQWCSLKIERSVENVEGYAYHSGDGCSPGCSLDLTQKRYRFIEADFSEYKYDQRNARLRDPDTAKRVDVRYRGYVETPGWYRFELVEWNDPQAEMYRRVREAEHEIHSRDPAPAIHASLYDINERYSRGEPLSEEDITYAGSGLGVAVATIAIDAPTARYERHDDQLVKEFFIDDGETHVRIFGDIVKDGESDEVLGGGYYVMAKAEPKDERFRRRPRPWFGFCRRNEGYEWSEYRKILLPALLSDITND